MSAELNLLFLEKKVEASRLCASLTEPFATGTVPCEAKALIADYDTVLKRMDEALNDLKRLNDGLGRDGKLEEGDVRHLRQRAEVAIGEIARVAQDFAAQIRFFEAMNPGEPAAAVKPILERFDTIDKATREVTTKDGPEEGDEIMPEETGAVAEDEADPMLM
ncbi:MAG: hypothetical protein IPP14_04625 [Planctomycetes bacterium]|nr:hypothetical protein [Planctomycetota bacterium]